METIGLRELNQNPSKAVARVRAGATLTVTDRGRPVLRMVPEIERPDTLREMVEAGTVAPPAEHGMPDLVADLAPDVPNLSDVLIAGREAERNR